MDRITDGPIEHNVLAKQLDEAGPAERLAYEGYTIREIARAQPGNGVWLEDRSPLARFERDEISRVLG